MITGLAVTNVKCAAINSTLCVEVHLNETLIMLANTGIPI